MRHDSHYVEELSRSNKTIGRVIPLDKIYPNPDQPRIEFGDLSDLTSSIEEQGVLEPLLVKPERDTGRYMIIAGERRWRASALAGLKEVPCIELDIDEKSIAEIALVENLQRKDLTIWEIADGLADLKARYNHTHDDIAKKIGKSRTTITESLAIAGLPEDIRARCLDAKIKSKSTLVEISRQFDGQAMHKLIDKIENKGLTSTDLREKKAQKNKDSKVKNTGRVSRVNDISAEKKSYIYKSDKNNFELRIRFETSDVNSRDILKALKEAFDDVKTN
jgi:ParB family chromosome partitioning protein